MAGTLIITVPKSTVHALAFQGIPVYTGYSQIRDMLRRKFGEEYGLLFSEPVENKKNGEIDWYTMALGIPRKAEELPEAEKEQIFARLRAMADKISAYAAELASSEDPLKVTRGNILKLALSYPDNAYIYAAEQQPVLCCWGFAPGTPGVEPMSLTAIAPQKTAPPIPVPNSPPSRPAPPASSGPMEPRQPRSWAWLWWLLPLLLLILLLALLFTSFGSIPALSGQTLLQGPPLPFLENPPANARERAGLEEEIENLRRQLNDHIALCREEPAQPENPPPKEDALVIPDNARDTTFLEGKWLCETGLANSRTGQPVVVEFAFDAAGNGHCTVREQTRVCTGKAAAYMESGALHITHDELACPGGGNYVPQTIICQHTAGPAASCVGQAKNGRPWDASFTRLGNPAMIPKR